jgi:hypothetical protein
VHEVIFGVEVNVAGGRLGLHGGRVRRVLVSSCQHASKDFLLLVLGEKGNGSSRIECSTYIEVADTCFEGDDGSYRHGGIVMAVRSQ